MDAGRFAWFGQGEADGLRQNDVTDEALGKVIWPVPAGGLLTGLDGSASTRLEARPVQPRRSPQLSSVVAQRISGRAPVKATLLAEKDGPFDALVIYSLTCVTQGQVYLRA